MASAGCPVAIRGVFTRCRAKGMRTRPHPRHAAMVARVAATTSSGGTFRRGKQRASGGQTRDPVAPSAAGHPHEMGGDVLHRSGKGYAVIGQSLPLDQRLDQFGHTAQAE